MSVESCTEHPIVERTSDGGWRFTGRSTHNPNLHSTGSIPTTFSGLDNVDDPDKWLFFREVIPPVPSKLWEGSVYLHVTGQLIYKGSTYEYSPNCFRIQGGMIEHMWRAEYTDNSIPKLLELLIEYGANQSKLKLYQKEIERFFTMMGERWEYYYAAREQGLTV